MLPNKKDSVLRKIREALVQPTPIPFSKSEGKSSVFQPLGQEVEIEFAERFTDLGGKFAFCFSEADAAKQCSELIISNKWNSVYCIDPKLSKLVENTIELQQTDLAGCDVAITGCEFMVGRTGSIVMSAAEASGRNTSVYCPIHICIAYTSQMVYDIKDALEGMKEKYGKQIPSLITFATGPSRTADIEKTLVVGVHGPKEVYVFLIDDKI